ASVAARGPFGELGPWQSRQTSLPGLRKLPSYAVPCASWQVKHVTPCVYMRLVTKSLPCIRFLWAVPSAKCVNVVSPSLCSSRLHTSLSFRVTSYPMGQSEYLPAMGFFTGRPCELHWMHTSLAATATRRAALTIWPGGCFACSLPGPWQRSQP